MEMTVVNGTYNGERTEASLPVNPIIKQALLNLDYSQGAIRNQDAANQLADQFCLSDEQRRVANENGSKFWIMRINIAIQDLVVAGKIVRPKPATIITLEVLQNICVNFLQKLGYENVDVQVDQHQEDVCNATVDIKTKTKRVLCQVST